MIFKKRIGSVSKLLSPGYGWCQKCNTTWKFVEEHTTWYNLGRGSYALCEKCFEEIKNPADRLSYYANVHCLKDNWELIKKAVLEGR